MKEVLQKLCLFLADRSAGARVDKVLSADGCDRVGGGVPPGTASGAWAIGALAALRERGYLHRDSPSPEAEIRRAGGLLDLDYLQAYLSGRLFKTPVRVI